MRLAQLAADAGRKPEAVRLANEVKAAKTTDYVYAPKPNRYEGGPGETGRQPKDVADAILKKLQAGR